MCTTADQRHTSETSTITTKKDQQAQYARNVYEKGRNNYNTSSLRQRCCTSYFALLTRLFEKDPQKGTVLASMVLPSRGFP